jgi:hypothetical protein
MAGTTYKEKFHLSLALQHGHPTLSQTQLFAARADFPVFFGNSTTGGSFAFRFSRLSPEHQTLSLFSRR